MKALILSCGGSPEPLIFCINKFNPDFTYFLCSNDSVHIAGEIAYSCNLNNDQFNFKVVQNHESLEDSFAKSREIIQELQKEFDNIHIDFTGGTKPMVSGLVLAAIGEKCTYSYVGSKGFKGRDKEGLGIVQNGFESIKNQRDPYDVFAVMEFEKGIDFFNNYQFEASKSNFKEAQDKLESVHLKELSEIYLEIVDAYYRWDKFKNVRGKKLTLNNLLQNILNDINYSKYLKDYFEENYPDVIQKIEDNIKFLDLKLSKKGKIKPFNVKYYLPDLLNNANRRIEEGKYDDAVARLYRSIELIAQMILTDKELINESNLLQNSKFSLNIKDINLIDNINVKEVLDGFYEYNEAIEYGNKTFKIPLKKSYILLEAMGSDFAEDYLNDDDINRNIDSRNNSILAHGLQPIDEFRAKELYDQVVSYARRAFPDLDQYMEMSEFPKFE